MDFSRDGTLILSGSYDGLVYVFMSWLILCIVVKYGRVFVFAWPMYVIPRHRCCFVHVFYVVIVIVILFLIPKAHLGHRHGAVP